MRACTTVTMQTCDEVQQHSSNGSSKVLQNLIIRRLAPRTPQGASPCSLSHLGLE
jgi:hypothetical protein